MAKNGEEREWELRLRGKAIKKEPEAAGVPHNKQFREQDSMHFLFFIHGEQRILDMEWECKYRVEEHEISNFSLTH